MKTSLHARSTSPRLLTPRLLLIAVALVATAGTLAAQTSELPKLRATYRVAKRFDGVMRRYAQPDTVHCRIVGGAPGGTPVGDSAALAIEVRRGDHRLAVPVVGGRADVVLPRTFGWTLGDADTSSAPYTLTLTAGDVRRSTEIAVPERVADSKFERRGWSAGHEVARYTLTLFPFDRAELDWINRRILAEHIDPDIVGEAEVEVIGYVDTVGLRDHNFRLAERRADAIAEAIDGQVEGDRIRMLESRGVGAGAGLYTNLLPEGRFYNRAAQVIIYARMPASTGN